MLPQQGQVRDVLRGSTATTATPMSFALYSIKVRSWEERPTVQCCSLWSPSSYPVAYAAQFFQGDTATGAFGLSNNGLTDIVVGPLGKALFFAGQLAQAATRRLCAFGLQFAAQAGDDDSGPT
jgi:hypothetical protein